MDLVANFWRWIHLLDGGTLLLLFGGRGFMSSFVCRVGSSDWVDATLVIWRFNCVWNDVYGYWGPRGVDCASYEATVLVFQTQPLYSVVLGLGLCKPHYLGQLTLTIRGIRERLGGRRSGDFLLPLLVSLSVQPNANGWCQPPDVFLHSQTSFTVSRKRYENQPNRIPLQILEPQHYRTPVGSANPKFSPSFLQP